MSNLENPQKTLVTHHSKTDPYYARLKVKSLLSHMDSSKKTYHIALSFESSSLQFEPGDSLGILPENDPILVQRFLALLTTEPHDLIEDPRSGKVMAAEEFLRKKVNFARVNTSLLKFFLALGVEPSMSETIQDLLQPTSRAALKEFLFGKDLIDVISMLKSSPVSLQDLLPFLGPLLPRFYSISSSPKVYGDEIHLLVALLSYSHGDELRYGVASHFLCHLASDETPIGVYVQPAAHFRLPDDPEKDMIMIGPGTGVAPYRAFLQERIFKESTGRHWLFFGERNSQSDFLYEDYLKDLENQGLLKLTTAFSRDQKEKIYVQHKIEEHAAEIWQWLEKGAHLYVCGNASHMAKDVEAALLHLFQSEGGLSESEARAHLKEMRHSRQYMTDVY